MRIVRVGLIVCVALLLVFPLVAQEAEDNLKKEIEALKQGQQNINKQLEEIKKMIQAPPAAKRPSGPNVKDQVFDIGGSRIKGSDDAKLTLIEFTDYQCPFCARYARDTYPQIQKEYVDTGKLRYTLLDLPLESIHKKAFKAAEASHCAGDQGKYWEMHDRLFSNQRNLEPWSGHAEALGLELDKFDECLENGDYSKAIRNFMKQAEKAGITGTPGFVIARTDPEDPDKVKGVSFIRGAQPFAKFKSELDQALSAN